MPRIKLLDEETINKIAAGEVIERPASAVKELVENSLDAGAKRVLVEVAEGGKRLIRVTDDGSGMEPEDLPLAFQKHATSKIGGAGDLENIRTLGFRGEALASIASVSRCVEVYTKTGSDLSGRYLRLENGRIAETKEAGCPVGTSIAVHDLFYNVPARKKHLKGVEAELAHIVDLITEMAVINFQVSFELFTGKRSLFKSVRSQNWDDAILRVFGHKSLKAMSAFRASGRGWSLWGMAGDPLNTRSSPDRIFIYVNGRAVSSPAMARALRDAYRNIIPIGKSPVAVLSLQISPELVDVNVHPAKREIRLLREEEISSHLFQAVSETLRAHSEARPAEMPRAASPLPRADVARESEQRTLPLELGTELQLAVQDEPEAPRLNILGQILKLYIVAESESGLMLIDQHAAAERIRFEHLRERYRQKRIKQELAEPIAIELSPTEAILIQSWKETLEEIGFEVVPFGGRSYSVKSVPALGKRLENAEAVHDILRDLFARGRVGPDSTNADEILRLLACKGSIKSGRELSMTQMRELIADLYRCQDPLTCPHGRPVMVLLTLSQLERLFARR